MTRREPTARNINDSANVSALEDLAWRLCSWGRYDQAIEKYNQITAIDPEAPAAYLGRAAIWRIQGYFRDSILELQNLIRIDPQNKQPHVSLAQLYLQCRDLNYRDSVLAIECALDACELGGWKDDHDINLLAEAFYAAEMHDEAFAVIDRAIQRGGPNTDTFIELRGRYFYEIEERNEKKKWWWPFG